MIPCERTRAMQAWDKAIARRAQCSRQHASGLRRVGLVCGGAGGTCRSMFQSSAKSARMIWSESTKMTLRRFRGKSTSRKRILYAQMMRCLSVCSRHTQSVSPAIWRAPHCSLLLLLLSQGSSTVSHTEQVLSSHIHRHGRGMHCGLKTSSPHGIDEVSTFWLTFVALMFLSKF